MKVEEKMEKKKLEVDVYNGMFELGNNKGYPFVSCDEMSVLSVMKYYKKNLLPMMVKMNFMYKIKEEAETLVFTGYNPNLDLDFDLFANIGIKKISNTTQAIDSLSCIKRSISDNHPAQFMIDLFYQEGREYYYNNQHGGHYVLAYGFDDTKGELYIIDNVAGYDKYIIRYDDFDKLRGVEQNGEIWEYINNPNIDTFAPEYVTKMLMMYKTGIRNQMEEREESIELVNILIEKYDDFMMQPEFTSHINGVTYNKISEWCRMLYISKYMLYNIESQKKIENYLQEIVKDWKRINLFVKYKSAERLTIDDYSEERRILANIVKNERALNKALVTELL